MFSAPRIQLPDSMAISRTLMSEEQSTESILSDTKDCIPSLPLYIASALRSSKRRSANGLPATEQDIVASPPSPPWARQQPR